ncbi:MAG: protein kinase [Pyrinomonadaceae bacterium]|nr:protein kinase [Pyrinomonadaceae bacterium]MCX7640228.1 protein kinase [Pyrinomonadaceae bacterium]MDW8303927.1 protein kinase [Acidobacteriota bacterium]
MRECIKCKRCYDDGVMECSCVEGGIQTREVIVGSRLISGRYELTKRIGSGGMGHVYLGFDKKFTERKVAVKIIKPEAFSISGMSEEEILKRFRTEADLAARLRGRHIVSVLDFGETEVGMPYMVMEYVEGETLQSLLKREGSISLERAVGLLGQISEGLIEAHRKGIIHRDLKPGNVFLESGVGRMEWHVKIGDFGLAKLKEGGVGQETQGILGTPEYMAPEQIEGRNDTLDERVDIYALGVIGYVMLSGRLPFEGNFHELMVKKITREAPLISSFGVDVPKEVENVVMWAIRRDRAERPRSVEEWIERLERAAKGAKERRNEGETRLIVIAPQGAEVYVDDERRGTVGSTGRLIIRGIPIGRHVLRVSKAGHKDDEREIEIRGDVAEQVIQTQLKSLNLAERQGLAEGSSKTILPGIVACKRCGARFAEGVKFCGKCGNASFELVAPGKGGSSEIECLNCRSSIPLSAKFCGNCGMPVVTNTVSYQTQNVPFLSPEKGFYQQQRVCKRCGAIYASSAKFCGRCGISL